MAGICKIASHCHHNYVIYLRTGRYNELCTPPAHKDMNFKSPACTGVVIKVVLESFEDIKSSWYHQPTKAMSFPGHYTGMIKLHFTDLV